MEKTVFSTNGAETIEHAKNESRYIPYILHTIQNGSPTPMSITLL